MLVRLVNGRVEQVLAQSRQRALGREEALGASLDLKRRDGFQVLDCFLKREEDFLIAFVVVQINYHVRDPRDQASQNLTLHGCKVKEAIKHEQMHVREPGNTDIACSSSSPLRMKVHATDPRLVRLVGNGLNSSQ